MKTLLKTSGRILQWLLYLIVHLAIVIARYPLAPIAVVFFTSNDRRDLLFPFTWLGTIDNDLAGDSGWQTEHIMPGSDPLSTWNRIKWLWRNGGNRLNYQLLGCPDSVLFRLKYDWLQDRDWLWLRPDGYWMLRAYIPFRDVVIFENGQFCWRLTKRYLNLFWGWSLFGPIDGGCKFTFTTRIKSAKPA
ncbi:hypothetical protein [Methylomonas sp. ZR1]|uniref:DUF7338 family protein n=1 Tax=Methylomonas sp. ZR1 TaxID=1797072 RepID=UPI001492C456|nr:hypothetical protein [Methylomonas sp. ZR1]NOV29184.1 hypothetical protein [Methylomonas sp. ZR1]